MISEIKTESFLMKKKILLSVDIILKLLISCFTAFYVYRTLPAFLYCMYERYKVKLFYNIFCLADFSIYYEFSSAEYLYDHRFVYTLVLVIVSLIVIDTVIVFSLEKFKKYKIITLVLSSMIILVSLCIASNSGFAAWVYQY